MAVPLPRLEDYVVPVREPERMTPAEIDVLMDRIMACMPSR